MNKVLGTVDTVDHPGPLPDESTVPGDGGNDTFTSCVVGIGTVTGGVLDPTKNHVDHAIDDADEDGTHNVSVYPGTTQAKHPPNYDNIAPSVRLHDPRVTAFCTVNFPNTAVLSYILPRRPLALDRLSFLRAQKGTITRFPLPGPLRDPPASPHSTNPTEHE